MHSNCLKHVVPFLISLICIVIINCLINKTNAVYADDSIKVPVRSYQSEDDYRISNKTKVDKMKFGKESLGKLYINGNINDTSKYKKKTAYGVESGKLKLTYKYDGSLLDEDGKYYLTDDNRWFDEDIGKGKLKIEKSKDGKDWKAVGNTIVNLFEDNKSGVKDFYTTSGKDLGKGTFYKITIYYETCKNEDWAIDTSYYHTEIYEFFACNNSGKISLHDLSADISDVVLQGYSAEEIKAGETLLDGATTNQGFSVDMLGSSYTVTVNNEKAADGDEYKEDGKYVVNVKTKLGKEITTTVYVFSGGADNGKSIYFYDYLVTEKRIFRECYTIPVFSKDSIIKLKRVNEDIPALTGTITNETTGNTITLQNDNRSERKYYVEPGKYVVELYSGNTGSGSYYHYTFTFEVLNEDAKSYVNKSNIYSRESVCDFKPEHYVVTYNTTRGGNIYVCFDSYDESFKYAYQIEKRYIEYHDGKIYYKGSSNQKIEYPQRTTADRLSFTALINENAKKNIEISYFDPSIEEGYMTLDQDKDLKTALEELSLKDSIWVFPTDEEKEKLLCRDLPIINGYKFMHIADYDVQTITAKNKVTGEVIDIDFSSTSVNSQLKDSAVYIINETNEYGDQTSYEVLYLDKNETTAVISVNDSGKEKRIDVSAESHIDITADSIQIDQIKNDLDNMSLIKIESLSAYDKATILCYLDSAKDLTLYQEGDYLISFIDRAGNSFSFKVTISGALSGKDIKSGNSKTFSDIYNSIHINTQIKEKQ